MKMNLGIITYATPHLKTEQVIMQIHNLSSVQSLNSITVFALPFSKRRERDVLFQHRPNQFDAVPPKLLCETFGFSYTPCKSDTDITDECDIYLITGAGILSEKAVENKKIINCHPGIIPAARGLDAFKWSIYNMTPVGNTLHYINKEVDMGTIISVIPTPVYSTDTISSFARRHYENEIHILSNFIWHLEHSQNPFLSISMNESTRRMDKLKEREMIIRFDEYKKKFSGFQGV